jgi:SAM-dependent methyltransferase
VCARPTSGPDRVEHWFEPIAEHLGAAYLRYSHTKGTRQEIDHLVGVLGLRPGMRVLDVGCGPGRHVHELARRGIACHGVDISSRFITIARRDAPPQATFERLDARQLPFDASFDAAICLCQGAFGMMTDPADDEAVLAGVRRSLRAGGRLALTAFNAYFVIRHHVGVSFDAERAVAHERTSVRSEVGDEQEVDLWTGCYTPRELHLLLRGHGFTVERVSGVEPGAYGDRAPSVDLPELLVTARC